MIILSYKLQWTKQIVLIICKRSLKLWFLSLLFRCFLLTPKLLPDLVYSDECSVLNIKTGPYASSWANGGESFT